MMARQLAVLALAVSTTYGAWGPREALVAHEIVHEASHEAEASAAGGADAHGEAGLAHLQAVVDDERATVAKIKKTGVDMYKDAGAVAAVGRFQAATRRLLEARFGPGPSYRLEMRVTFPESMGGDAAVIELETAPIAWMPHAVYVFLDAAVTRKGPKWSAAFHRNAGHVLQAFLRAGPGAMGLAFQEYDARFPHEKYTLGFAGRPGGPEFYISTVDNVANHGPGSQGSKTEADSCFARVVRGFDVVERMRKQPAPKGMGFINDPAGYVVIDDIFLKDA